MRKLPPFTKVQGTWLSALIVFHPAVRHHKMISAYRASQVPQLEQSEEVMDEQRLLMWAGLPDGTTVTINVDGGKYTVNGNARLRTSTGITKFNLGPAELVSDKFEVPISSGVTFRLLLTITYISKDQTSAKVHVKAFATDDSVLTDDDGNEFAFEGDYTGSIGSDSPEDEVLIIVTGGE